MFEVGQDFHGGGGENDPGCKVLERAGQQLAGPPPCCDGGAQHGHNRWHQRYQKIFCHRWSSLRLIQPLPRWNTSVANDQDVAALPFRESLSCLKFKSAQNYLCQFFKRRSFRRIEWGAWGADVLYQQSKKSRLRAVHI